MIRNSWAWLKWILAGLLAVVAYLGCVIYGKRTAQVLGHFAREKEARADRLQAAADHARARATKAKSDAEAKAHIERADTMELRVVDLETERANITKNLTEKARRLSDADYGADFNRRHAAGARSNSQG
jgi:hypothetical protein